MAGYIMTLDSEDSLIECISTGTYSTNLSEPSGSWKAHHEGTFADYFSMKQGDSIYFFIKRKIYGIGAITNVKWDCKFLNYINGDIPQGVSEEEYYKSNPLLSYGKSNNRCFCTFAPSPYFFELGVDMDDALSSNPDKFKMLRAMWKVSFIKIDDEENKALQDIILKRNEENLYTGNLTYSFDNSLHLEIESHLTDQYRLSPYNLLAYAASGNLIKHEMAIEAALCDILGKENDTPFGKWDYVSHQVIASPFKAIDYMDKMDIFGYRYISGYRTISKYLVIEIKKNEAQVDAITQIMKYVDWINQEYTFGDYSMIEAYIVAADFPQEVIEKKNNDCIRNFTKGYRPTIPCKWNFIKLIRYEYRDGKLNFFEA